VINAPDLTFRGCKLYTEPPLVGGSVCLVKEEFKNADAGHLSIKSVWASNLKMRSIGMRIEIVFEMTLLY